MDTQTKVIQSTDDLPNTDLLGKRPVVLLGCDTRELSSILGFAFVAALLTAFVLSIFAGFVFIVLFFFILWICFCGLGIIILREEKRAKPYGYYIQKFLRMMGGLARGRAVYIPAQSGWDTRRHRNNSTRGRL